MRHCSNQRWSRCCSAMPKPQRSASVRESLEDCSHSPRSTARVHCRSFKRCSMTASGGRRPSRNGSSAVVVEESALLVGDPDLRSFHNANTPAEFDRDRRTCWWCAPGLTRKGYDPRSIRFAASFATSNSKNRAAFSPRMLRALFVGEVTHRALDRLLRNAATNLRGAGSRSPT